MVNIDQKDIDRIKDSMPILPAQLKEKFMSEYGLSEYDSDVLLADKEVCDFFIDCLEDYLSQKQWQTG